MRYLFFLARVIVFIISEIVPTWLAFNNMAFPAFTTVNQPLDEIAAKSFELLCKKMNQKDDVQTIEKIVLHASLAKRES